MKAPRPMKVVRNPTTGVGQFVFLEDAERYASARVRQALRRVVANLAELEVELDNEAYQLQHPAHVRNPKREGSKPK